MPKESYFANQMKKDFDNLGWFFHKLPDSIRSAETRFNPVKLFDAFVLKNGMFAAIEFKMVKGPSFPFSQVRESQVGALLEIEKAKAPGFLFLNHRYGDNTVIVWRIQEYIDLVEYWTIRGRKSIPLQEYPESWIILRRERAHWKLEKVIKEIEEKYAKCGVS